MVLGFTQCDTNGMSQRIFTNNQILINVNLTTFKQILSVDKATPSKPNNQL